jgi:hypothetical protein
MSCTLLCTFVGGYIDLPLFIHSETYKVLCCKQSTRVAEKYKEISLRVQGNNFQYPPVFSMQGYSSKMAASVSA